MSIHEPRPSMECTRNVLVVENREETRQDHVKNLVRWKYTPIVAQGDGQALIDDAIRKAQEQYCPVAFIDMCLLNDNDRNDTSGLILAEFLSPTTACIIITGYGTMQTAVKVMRDKAAVDFIGKEEGPKRLREAVDAVFKRTCQCRDLEIKGQSASEIISKLKVKSPILTYEIECLIKRLYSQSRERIAKVILQSIDEHYTSSDGAIPGERSRVLVAQALRQNGQWHQQEIIKIAQADRIAEEIKHYRDYVRPHLQSRRTARIEDVDEKTLVLWNLGAIRYTDVLTDDVMPLWRWYASEELKNVKGALTDLFEQTLGPWYRQRSDNVEGYVYHYYTDRFDKLRKRINSYTSDRPYINIPKIFPHLPDPVLWAREHEKDSIFISYWNAHTHGDLHSDNVFVDEHGETRVIDFERSGPGYILRDFAELEVDIRLRLLRLNQDQLPLAFHLDKLLFEPASADKRRWPRWESPPDADPDTQQALRKAFETICHLRQIAVQMTGLHPQWMKEYYWAVLMETLISVVRDYEKWKDRAAANLAKNRALLSAGMICERLGSWSKKWPPESWSLIGSGRPIIRSAGGRWPDARHNLLGEQSAEARRHVFEHGYALIVGVGETRYEPRWSLDVSIRDATQVYEALTSKRYCGYREKQVKQLGNRLATKNDILSGLRWLANQAQDDPDMTVLIYFSGHGWQHRSGRYALIPSDVRPSKDRSLDLETVLWADDFTAALRTIEAQSLLVLLDTCHAGSMAAAKGDEEIEPPPEFRKAPPPDELLQHIEGDGRVVISSSRGTQESYIRSDGSLSIFTYHLLEVLRGQTNRAGDKEIRVSTLIDHLSRKVRNSAWEQWRVVQEPWVDQNSNNFVIARLPEGSG